MAEKSAFVDLTYNDGSNAYNKEKGNNVAFYVFNDRLKSQKKFEVSGADKVLLPQSQDSFTVYLTAMRGDYNITVTASKSLIGTIVSFTLAITAIMMAYVF